MIHQKSKVQTAARIILGAVFVTFGLNGFIGFMPAPPHSGQAAAYLGGLAAAGYMFPLIKGVELVTGLLILSGRYVPLALTVLAPVVLNIVLFHLFLEPQTLALPLVTLVLGLYLAWSERAAYAALFRSTPASEARARVASRDLAASA